MRDIGRNRAAVLGELGGEDVGEALAVVVVDVGEGDVLTPLAVSRSASFTPWNASEGVVR